MSYVSYVLMIANLHKNIFTRIVEGDYYRPSVVTLIQNEVDFVVNVSVSTIVLPLAI